MCYSCINEIAKQLRKALIMNKLLIIDPQNDFCDEPGTSGKPALPVSGAYNDIVRISGFIDTLSRKIDSITVTLDSHPAVAIERPGFWMNSDGQPVAPFTVITSSDIESAKYVPRNVYMKSSALAYTWALEKAGKYQLMVWPTHCVLGTWGHAMPNVLADSLLNWETAGQIAVKKVLKGMDPLTEQYSAISAEVSEKSDINWDLIESVRPIKGELLFVAGEASSHCVRATMLDLLPVLSSEEVSRIVLLNDCMSPVGGFETQANAFIEHAKSMGAQSMSAAQAIDLI
jgi:nicotinamidase/pyrazinamidase